MKKIIILILILKNSIINAQVFGTQEMIEDENINVKPWVEDNKKKYSGFYGYGESEAESTIHLAIYDNLNCVQLQNQEFGNINITTKPIFYCNYKNFTNVRIKRNKFYSDQSNGEFVTFNYNNKKEKGLKLYKPPIQTGDKGHYEIGVFFKQKESEGKYPFTKTKILTGLFLKSISKFELKIMRNEVYARYHYIFKTRKMKEYFKNQEWYSGYYKNVDSFLTEIEKENIKRIQKYEKL